MTVGLTPVDTTYAFPHRLRRKRSPLERYVEYGDEGLRFADGRTAVPARPGQRAWTSYIGPDSVFIGGIEKSDRTYEIFSADGRSIVPAGGVRHSRRGERKAVLRRLHHRPRVPAVSRPVNKKLNRRPANYPRRVFVV